MLIDKILATSPFLEKMDNKNDMFLKIMIELTKLHYDKCSKYKKILNALNKNNQCFKNQKDIFLKSDLGLKYVSEIANNFISNIEDREEKNDTIEMYV